MFALQRAHCHGAANDNHATAFSRRDAQTQTHTCTWIKVHILLPHSLKHMYSCYFCPPPPTPPLHTLTLNTTPPPSMQVALKKWTSEDDSYLHLQTYIHTTHTNCFTWHHMPKQTSPAAPVILSNVFIMMPVIICCGSRGETEHKEGELESDVQR